MEEPERSGAALRIEDSGGEKERGMSGSPAVVMSVATATALLIGGCDAGADDDVSTSPPLSSTGAAITSAPPESASVLLSTADMDEATRFMSPQAPRWKDVSGGVLVLPTVQLCDGADEHAVDARDGLDWQAVTQMTDQVNIHTVFQEAVIVGQPEEVEQTFSALEAGLRTCVGETTSSEDGRAFTSEPDDVPTSADDQVMTRDTYDDGAVFTTVLLREGTALVHLSMAPSVPVPREYPFSDAVVREIVERSIERLAAPQP